MRMACSSRPAPYLTRKGTLDNFDTDNQAKGSPMLIRFELRSPPAPHLAQTILALYLKLFSASFTFAARTDYKLWTLEAITRFG
jgi:hypothetical protein